ncbi:DUF6264 family protein [Microbacterium sp. 2FI]|uniref:DUF6264 family protein n=1 Tax=Microbacterium sp. 2FI TaxID=2502193 RepID=UPI0010F9C038|nr:DUF6264 family protein [Microbacterium sp. 2FI]
MTAASSGGAPESAPDPRPRPAYGEYATPEEQRARIKQPDVTHALETGQPVDAPAGVPAVAAPAPAPATDSAVRADAAPPRRRAVDRIVTAALLGYGLISVISSFVAMADYPAYAETLFDIMGVDTQLTDPDAGQVWGTAAGIVLVIGWMLTAALSWLSIRRGRLSWWIPIVGGIVFTLIAGVLMVVPIMTDPAVWDALVAQST